jgi:hypothetical protein
MDIGEIAYASVSERTFRRYVKTALDWELGNLKRIPRRCWQQILGISPPGGVITEKVLREKAFELLRHHLRQHELLARK